MTDDSDTIKTLFYRFLTQSDNGILLLDDKNRILWANPASCRVLSLTETQILNSSMSGPEINTGIDAGYRLKPQDGDEIIFKGSVQNFTENGSEFRLLHIRNRSIISPLSGAEADLLITHIQDSHATDDILVWAVDTDFRYLYFNNNHKNAMKRVWNADIKPGTYILDYITDPEYRIVSEKNYRSILEGKPRNSIDHFTLKSGEDRYYENFGHLTRDSKDNISGLILYTVDITKKTENDNKLHLSLNLLESIMNSPEDLLIFSIDTDYKYLFFNKAHQNSMKRVWGTESKLGSSILEMIPDGEYRTKTKSFYDQSLTGIVTAELSTIRRHGEAITQRENISQPIKSENGDILGITIFSFDVTERLQAENALRDSLKEKEFLLKEIHHRIKNNFQMISGMLGIQKNTIGDEAAKVALQDSLMRVNTMGFIHETLYKGSNLGAVNMHDYCRTLVNSLRKLYSAGPGIEIFENIDDIELEIDRAIPAGLILNELLTNSLKYAFKERTAGAIKISLKKDRQNLIYLKVEDNGAGLADNLDLDKSATLGMKLVSAFVTQLNGNMEMKSEKGLSVEIKF